MAPTKLTISERDRYDTIRSCIDGEITNKEASIRLGLKVRQVQRIKLSVEAEGEKGVVHKSKGKLPSNVTCSTVIKEVTAFLKQKRHRDFGPTFAQEKLALINVTMNTETLRLLMIKNDLWKPQVRRGPQIHREWRERMASTGELVQFDGSYHDWFENGGEECLLAAIDDATGKIMKGVFEDNESVLAVFRFWITYLEVYGRPVAIYLDKFSTYKVNRKNAVDNKEFITQFQRAMGELGVQVITAHSPEAKGRVERLFGTLQDRAVKEMRLANIKNRSEANLFLDRVYLPDHNKRFSVPARNIHDAHRPLTDELRVKLPSIFSVQSKRRVNNDYTIQYKTKWFQLADRQETTVYKRDEVIVEEHLNNTIHIRIKATYLKYRELPERPKPVHIPIIAITKEKPSRIPPKDHPWRKFNF